MFKSNRTVKKLSFFLAMALLLLYVFSHLFYLSLFNYFSIDQTDSRLEHEIEHIKLSLKPVQDSLILINDQEFKERDFNRVTENSFFLQIYDLKRNLFFKSGNIDFYYPIPLTYSTSKNNFIFADIELPSGKLRTCMTRVYALSGKEFIIQLSEINELYNRVIKKIFYFDLITLPFLLIFLFLMGNYFVKKIYSPIGEIIKTSKEITTKNLSKRFDPEGKHNDEINNLKITLNNLFERLETQVGEIANFSDNASHQLMTPLTAMQSELDFILKKDRSLNEYKETLCMFRELTGRMINIVKTLLLLTHPDKIISGSSRVFNLSNLFYKEIIPLHRRHKRITFSVPEGIYIKGSTEFISIVIYNLLDNAMKYSPESEKINFTVSEADDKLIMSCEDFGVGISREDVNKIFERFYRSENSELNSVKGYGLGLSLVRTIVESLNGKIIVETERPKGTKFIIELPAVKFGH